MTWQRIGAAPWASLVVFLTLVVRFGAVGPHVYPAPAEGSFETKHQAKFDKSDKIFEQPEEVSYNNSINNQNRLNNNWLISTQNNVPIRSH